MGMTCSFYRISDEKIAMLNSDPDLSALITCDDDPELYLRKKSITKPQPKRSLLQILLGKKPVQVPAEEISVPKLVWEESERAFSNIDKTWNLIHYGLTGDPSEGDWPYCFLYYPMESAFFSGDDGYTCFAYEHSQVQQIAEALKPVSADQILERLGKMSDSDRETVYLAGYWDCSDEEDAEYAVDGFETLKSFVITSAELGYGIYFEIG